tara:strand:- start:140 stop:523 length:384 start_codon:yes stop_codon:yes gene_type:complete
MNLINEQNKETLELNERDFLIYFQTSIRNLALYLSVSLAILGVSRAYREKNRLYNISFIVLSLIILYISLYNNYFLIKTLEKMKAHIGTNKYNIVEIINIPKMFFMLNIVLGMFSLYTLYREFTKKK